MREVAEEEREDDHRRDRLEHRPRRAEHRLAVAHLDVARGDLQRDVAEAPELAWREQPAEAARRWRSGPSRTRRAAAGVQSTAPFRWALPLALRIRCCSQNVPLRGSYRQPSSARQSARNNPTRERARRRSAPTSSSKRIVSEWAWIVQQSRRSVGSSDLVRTGRCARSNAAVRPRACGTRLEIRRHDRACVEDAVDDKRRVGQKVDEVERRAAHSALPTPSRRPRRCRPPAGRSTARSRAARTRPADPSATRTRRAPGRAPQARRQMRSRCAKRSSGSSTSRRRQSPSCGAPRCRRDPRASR